MQVIREPGAGFDPHDTMVFVRDFAKLDFNDSRSAVMDFIARRLEAAGIAEVHMIKGADIDLATFASGKRLAVQMTAVNPFLDFNAVAEAATRLEEGDAGAAVVIGAIPGTQPDRVVRLDRLERDGRSIKVWVDSQETFNGQVNLYKFKRLKVFLDLIEREPDLHRMDIPELMAAFRRHHSRIAGYCSGTDWEELTACPHCGSRHFRNLPGTASQPLIGFVASDIPLYRLCQGCGLGFMSPHVRQEHTERLYDDFDLEEAGTGDFTEAVLSSKQQTALRLIEAILEPNSRMIDLGAGSGQYSYAVKMAHPECSVIHSDFEARREPKLEEIGVETRSLNFVTEPIGDEEFDLVTAFEVIEHVSYPAFIETVENVRKALRPGGYFLFTTPDFDSPLVRCFDFYNAYAPHHLLLFGGEWLSKFFGDTSRGFDIVKVAAAADLLDDYESYFGYYRSTAPTFQQQASADLLLRLLENPDNRDLLIEQKCGSEIIMLLRKM